MIPKLAHRALVALVALVVVAAPAAAQYDPRFPKEELVARRAAFAEKIADGFAIVLGALAPAEEILFRQNNHLYYLTGVEIPEAVLLVDGASKRSTLFVPGVDGDDAEAGQPSLADRLKERTGVERVADLDGLVTTLGYLTFRGDRPLYVSNRPEELQAPDAAMARYGQQQRPWDGQLGRSAAFARWYRERFPTATIKSYDEHLDRLRWIKSDTEIAAMREAGRLSALGTIEAIRATRPGRFEYQVAAAADFVYRAGGAERLAFPHIAASGARANEWHYMENDAELVAGEVILLDTGAEFDYYAADITRTWPVGGRFTDEQEKMYRCVAEASQKMIAAIKPGVTIADLQKIAEQVYDEHGFGDIGPPRRQQGRTYVGHFVGLSVHDVGPRDEPFVPGVVFNVEPILEKPGIHFRIEDTVLVTADGHENFTAAAPLEIEDLYRFYDQGSELYD
jgi:Xaa-Pro aminopeptidase